MSKCAVSVRTSLYAAEWLCAGMILKAYKHPVSHRNTKTWREWNKNESSAVTNLQMNTIHSRNALKICFFTVFLSVFLLKHIIYIYFKFFITPPNICFICGNSRLRLGGGGGYFEMLLYTRSAGRSGMLLLARVKNAIFSLESHGGSEGQWTSRKQRSQEGQELWS